MTETYSQRLAATVLPDVDGNNLRLGPFWEHSPSVLVFLRHYG